MHMEVEGGDLHMHMEVEGEDLHMHIEVEVARGGPPHAHGGRGGGPPHAHGGRGGPGRTSTCTWR